MKATKSSALFLAVIFLAAFTRHNPVNAHPGRPQPQNQQNNAVQQTTAITTASLSCYSCNSAYDCSVTSNLPKVQCTTNQTSCTKVVMTTLVTMFRGCADNSTCPLASYVNGQNSFTIDSQGSLKYCCNTNLCNDGKSNMMNVDIKKILLALASYVVFALFSNIF